MPPLTLIIAAAALALAVFLALAVYLQHERLATNERRDGEIELRLRRVEIAHAGIDVQLPAVLEALGELKRQMENLPSRMEYTQLMGTIGKLQTEVLGLSRELSRSFPSSERRSG